MHHRAALFHPPAPRLGDPTGSEPRRDWSVLAWLQNMPCFALSAALHLAAVLVAIAVVYQQDPPRSRDVPITLSLAAARAPAPPAYDPKPPRGLEKRQNRLDLRSPLDREIRLHDEPEPALEMPLELPDGTSLEHVTDRFADFSDVALGNANGTMGIGFGIGGPYGERGAKGTLYTEGAPPPSEEAVRAALEWLRRHQHPDGSWKAARHLERCGRRCTNATGGAAGAGFDEADIGVTGLAMLAFAGYGQTHRHGAYDEYVDCLRKAVAFLKRAQAHSAHPDEDGRFGDARSEHWMYNHLIATLAMAELYAMSADHFGLRRPVTDAVKLILRAQNDGLGWRYGIKPRDNDTSVTGWAVLALKAAKTADLDIPDDVYDRAFAGALNWFRVATGTNGRTGYMAPGDEGSRLAAAFPEPYPFSKEPSCMTAVSVLCRLFAGEARQSPAVRRGVDVLMTELPRWQEPNGRILSTVNLYYWYYGSYALFQYGGPAWKRWNQAMFDALLKSQRQGGDLCEDGSWDPIDEWGPAGGRVYATALGAMTLEVYYRYRRL